MKASMAIASFSVSTVLGFSGWLGLTQVNAQTPPTTVSAVGTARPFNCNDSESRIRSSGTPRITSGNTTIYIGYQQVSSVNKDPRVIRFDSGRRVWCRSDYEVTRDDGTGYGLIWDGRSTLYGVFSSTGTQGTTSQDFRRFARQGWLTSYGSGGGAKIAVIAKIDPATGNIGPATFLSALNSSGRSNSLRVTNLALVNNSNLRINAASYSFPRRTNRSRMTCSGRSPFSYMIEFTPALNAPTQAQAANCS